MPKKKRVRCNKTRFVVAIHVSTCVTSPAPDSKIKPSTAVFASVCLVFPNLLRHLERQPDF